MPLRTSSQRQAVERRAPAARRAAGSAPAARRAARGAVPAASGRRIERRRRRASRVPQVAASPRRCAGGRSPARPQSGISALASLSLHLARSTNIDRRFSVGAQQVGRAGQQELVVGRAARRRSWPAAAPWPSRSRPAAPRPGRGRRRPSSAGRAGSWPRRRRAARITPQSVEPARRRRAGRGDGHAPIIISRHDCVASQGSSASRGRRGR